MDFFFFGHALPSNMDMLRLDTILKQLPDASFGRIPSSSLP